MDSRASIVPSVSALLATLMGTACSVATTPLVTTSPQTTTSTTQTSLARDGTDCANLAGISIAGVNIEGVSHLKAGDTVIERPPFFLSTATNYCRVAVTLSSGPGSNIKSEYWLPDTWNSKFFAVGGGGFNGGLDSAALILLDPIAQGYAGAASDAGHPTAEGAAWAHNDPVKLADWANRANHQTAVFGKILIETYYGQGPSRSYFEGCSNGGRDALTLVQRHPDDFDGIISGAPAADWTGLMSSFAANRMTLNAFGTSGQDAKFKVVSDAVLAKCDALDGVEDGVIEQPRKCEFDPSEVQCSSGQTSNCLSAVEVDAMRAMYAGHSLADGRKVFAGFPLGAEAERQGWRDPSETGTGQMSVEYFRWMVYGDPNWDPDEFDINRDYAAAVDRTGSIIDASDPDIAAFTGRGGKLLMWHGWNDMLIAAGGTIDYYDAVRNELGPEADESVRLFMAPGANHCFGGAGPSFFDRLGELDRWVETGAPPSRIVATKYENDMFRLINLPTKALRTRPLCPWPQTAQYNGTGSTDDAENFTCGID